MKFKVIFLLFLIGIFAIIFIYLKNLNLKLEVIKAEIEGIESIVIKNTNSINDLHKGLKIKDIKKLTVTAYSPRKSETDSTPYITASMEKVAAGGVAVSRDLFAEGWVFGNKVYIEGYGIYRINDLMHERFTNTIDIFFWDTKKAKRFGRKELAVALVKE